MDPQPQAQETDWKLVYTEEGKAASESEHITVKAASQDAARDAGRKVLDEKLPQGYKLRWVGPAVTEREPWMDDDEDGMGDVRADQREWEAFRRSNAQ